MRPQSNRFCFRGFVALADLLFALSAGLLLLDPGLTQPRALPAEELPAPTPEPVAAPPDDAGARILQIAGELQRADKLLAKLEAETTRLEQQARLVLRSE